MKSYNVVQMSPEWFELRRGVASASRFDEILTPTGALSKQADGYIAELVAEQFVLDPNAMTERSMNAAMRHGIACEPEARRWYEYERGCEAPLVGFCTTDDGRFGCSPDSLVGEEGLLELKCPQGATHVKYLMEGKLPPDYRPQVYGQLLVTGRKWCDFVSYCAGLPPLMVRVEPDEYTIKLRDALEAFWVKYQAALAKVRALKA